MRGRRAFTLVEMLFAAFLCSLLLRFMVLAVQWGRSSVLQTEKAAVLMKFRNAATIISRDLNCATEFLFPNRIETTPTDLLVYKNLNNEVMAMYLADDGLKLFNHTDNSERLLFPLVEKFQTRLIQDNLVEYRIGFRNDKMAFTIQNWITPYNSVP